MANIGIGKAEFLSNPNSIINYPIIINMGISGTFWTDNVIEIAKEKNNMKDG